MKEEYLHGIWQRKRLLTSDLRTTKGKELQVIHFGYYNRFSSGPDFSSAVIEISGEVFLGAIEMHVRSSDWYRHNHDKDPNYNNVVLHVVYEHDREVLVEGKELPVLELTNYIEPEHLARSIKGWISMNDLPCASFSRKTEVLDSMKEIVIQQRLKNLRQEAMRSERPVLEYLIIRAFGMGKQINFFAFDEAEVNISGKNGLRPQNRIETRHIQLQKLLDKLRSDNDIHRQINLVIRAINKELKEIGVQQIGQVLQLSLIVNAVIPYRYFMHELTLEEVFKEMRSCRPESNHITRIWQSYDFPVNNLFDSQGLLWLYNSKCSEKKCLTCTVGKAMINDPKSSLLF